MSPLGWFACTSTPCKLPEELAAEAAKNGQFDGATWWGQESYEDPLAIQKKQYEEHCAYHAALDREQEQKAVLEAKHEEEKKAAAAAAEAKKATSMA